MIKVNSRPVISILFGLVLFYPSQSISATSPVSTPDLLQQEKTSPPSNSDETENEQESSIGNEDGFPTQEDPVPKTDDRSVSTETIPPVDTTAKPIIPKESAVPPVDEQANSVPPPETEIPAKEAPTENVQPQSLASLTLLSNVILSGKYTQSNTVELTFSGQGLIDVNAQSELFAIFQIPERLFPYIDENSIVGTYTVPELAALGVVIKEKSGTFSRSDQTVDAQQHQIRFNTKSALSLNISLLATYKYSLTFKLKRLPLDAPQRHEFIAGMTKSAIDITSLSNGVGRWALTIPEVASPLYFLEVPDSISFGTVGIRTNMQHLYRSSDMTILISHQNAIGYPYQLTARASPLTSFSQTLNDVIQFKRKDGSTVPLNGAAQLISSGKMNSASTSLIYALQEGLFLDLNGQIPKAESFATTIEWTLIDSL